MTEFYFCGEGEDDDCFTMAGRWKIISPAFGEKMRLLLLFVQRKHWDHWQQAVDRHGQVFPRAAFSLRWEFSAAQCLAWKSWEP